MSSTWLLKSTTGDLQFSKGDCDLQWQDGRPVSITNPSQILDQRVRKTAQTPLGANKFDPDLGFIGKSLIGGKSFGDETAKLLGVNVQSMVAALIDSQTEVAARIPLSPGEMIQGLNAVAVEQSGTELQVSVGLDLMGSGVLFTNMMGKKNGV